MKTKATLAATIVVCALPLAAHAGPRDVDLKAPDGTLLKATYFAAPRPGPGVVLLHMCNSQRKAWAGLGEKLAAQGIHAIALDYRGYGESGGTPVNDLPVPERQRAAQQWPADIDAAFEFLVSQPGVDRARIGAAGGSCGVDNAIQLARRHSEVKTLVLLAGGTNAAGEQFLAQSPWMPVFASAAHDDGGAVETMRWLLGFSSGRANHMKAYPNGGHGTEMFAVHRDLEPAIVAWFDRYLVKEPVRAAASATAAPGPSARIAAALREPGGGGRLLADLKAARLAAKSFTLAPEGVINAVGYQLIQDSRVPDAIGLFELNVEAYPGSANAFDSLADGYVAAGDKVKALEFARKALAALPADKSAPDEFKQLIRESAERKIRELGGGTRKSIAPMSRTTPGGASNIAKKSGATAAELTRYPSASRS
jgi:dienelactone hydrolase